MPKRDDINKCVFRVVSVLTLRRFGRSYRSRDNAAEFFSFCVDFTGYVAGEQSASHRHSKPNRCFVQLFEYDPHFMDKVGTTFGAPRFGVIWSCRSTRSQHLSSVVCAGRRSWKLLHQTSDFGAKVDEPRLQQVCLRGLCCRRTHGVVKSRFASKSSHNKFRITDSH